MKTEIHSRFKSFYLTYMQQVQWNAIPPKLICRTLSAAVPKYIPGNNPEFFNTYFRYNRIELSKQLCVYMCSGYIQFGEISRRPEDNVLLTGLPLLSFSVAWPTFCHLLLEW